MILAPPLDTDTARERRSAMVADLRAAIARHLPHDGERVVSASVSLGRTGRPTKPMYVLYEPSFVVVAQGEKEVLLGADTYSYDETAYFFSSVALPITGRVVRASRGAPYLSVRIALTPELVAPLVAELPPPPPSRGGSPSKGLDVRPLDGALLDAVVRLVRLADTPEHAAVLGPLALREVVYRLYVGGQAERLRHVATAGGRARGITAAVAWLREHYRRPMRVEALGKLAALSPSALHRHFRAVTGMSPLQYQKTLRLEEAKRLMLVDAVDAAAAGFRVGYNDASQFTREYRRHFGAPPRRDVRRSGG